MNSSQKSAHPLVPAWGAEGVQLLSDLKPHGHDGHGARLWQSKMRKYLLYLGSRLPPFRLIRVADLVMSCVSDIPRQFSHAPTLSALRAVHSYRRPK